MSSTREAISERIRELRRRHFGPRGKSEFATRLGIPLDEYDALERNATPPADLLIRMCELTGEDLQWLLTGVAARGTVVISGARGRHQALLARVAQLVEEQPGLAAPIESFVDLLAAGQNARSAAQAALPTPAEASDVLIPIFDMDELPDEFPPGGPGGGLFPLANIPSRSALAGTLVSSSAVRLCEPAAARRPGASESESIEAAGAAPGTRSTPSGRRQFAASDTDNESADGRTDPDSAQLITLRDAAGDSRQYLDAAQIRRWFPTAFGVRLTDSALQPLFASGDALLTAVDAAPELGLAALCRFTSGETRCRIWLGASGDEIHLGRPSDGAHEREPRASLRWSLGILYRVVAA